MTRETLAAAAFGLLLAAASALKLAEEEQRLHWKPLSVRRGVPGDAFPKKHNWRDVRGHKNKDVIDENVLAFQNLQEVLETIGKSLPKGFGQDSTIVNVGAAYKDVDPIYNLNLTQSHPAGYNLIGYECTEARIPHLRKMRPDVNIRQMCVTGPSIVKDLKALKVENRFSLLKTDIDSVDGPVLDHVLGAYQPYVVYAEIMWDFAPPVEFSLVKVEGAYNPFTGGCFGMSLSMADRILKRNGYRLIEAAHANIMAVREDVAHLFEDRPHDPWFWFQSVKSGFYHTHWLEGGIQHAAENTPLGLYSEGLGLYSELAREDGNDNFQKPVKQIRTMDEVMARIAGRVAEGCKISGGQKYMLAVGDRCCAPQWGDMTNCTCEFPSEAEDHRIHAA